MTSYHHGNLRDALVEAAVELGRAGGPGGIGIRELARRIGVSPTAAYRHFADRDALLREVARVGVVELEACMLRRMQRVRGADPAERARHRLRATGEAYVDFALKDPGLFAVAFADVTFDDLAGSYQHLEDALDDCLATGFVAASKRGGAELTCWAGVHGFAMLYGSGPLREAPRSQRDAELARLLDRIEYSLRA